MSKFNKFKITEPALFKAFVIALVFGVMIFVSNSNAQEMDLATFQETAQILIDRSLSQNVTASITLQSTSIQEMTIPQELEQKIKNNDRIISMVLTNQNNCVLGVFNESCIMINITRDPTDKGIIAIQDDAKEIGGMYIDDINEFFDTSAKFHSIYIHVDDKTNKALETSGAISGKGTISAVYTMPQEATDSMYEKISAILIPREIRNSGGFYEVAKKLSFDEDAKMTFSIIPMDQASLFQLRVSKNYANEAQTIGEVNPLKYLQTEQLKRSEYFSSGFYPLNSIIQVVVLSPQSTSISEVSGNIVPTQVIDGEKIPMDITNKGWVFDPEEGEMIQGKYIFGKENQVNSNDLLFSIDGESLDKPKSSEIKFDESIAVVVIIVVGGIAAAVFYLRGYKRKT